MKTAYVITCAIVIWILIVSQGVLLWIVAFRDPHKLDYPRCVGNQIVQALSDYKNEHGVYPEDLGKLIPVYLPAIPEPDFGTNRWDYFQNEQGASFELGLKFGENTYHALYYESDGHFWWVDM